MQIITHRGIDCGRDHYFAESSREAFTDQLSRGFGLEFDLQFTKDRQMVVIHDSNLKRITQGRDERLISEVTAEEILNMDFSGCHLMTIPKIFNLLMSFESRISALHLKYLWQNPEYLDLLSHELQKIDLDCLIIFDATVKTASYMKRKNPKTHLAPSVSHVYDIERYSQVVGKTLITLDEAIKNKNLFDWVWLDEWDKSLLGGGEKTFYEKQTFDLLRKNNIKIALVTPELHATSPGLLGGEAHQDASSKEILIKRLKEIINLKPDAVCTDWPDLVKDLNNIFIS